MARRHRLTQRLRRLERRLGASPPGDDFIDFESLTPSQRRVYEAFTTAYGELPEHDQDLVDETLEFAETHWDTMRGITPYPSAEHERVYERLMDLTAVHWDALYERENDLAT